MARTGQIFFARVFVLNEGGGEELLGFVNSDEVINSHFY